MSELKPCPFCGSSRIETRTDGANWCRFCGAESGDNWNARPLESDLQSALTAAQEENKTLREALKFYENVSEKAYTALNGGKKNELQP